MSKYASARYCADPDALMVMKRDGLGWGHDLECGCFRDTAGPAKLNTLARIMSSMRRRN